MKYEYEIVTIDTHHDFGRAGFIDEEEILKMMHDMAKKRLGVCICLHFQHFLFLDNAAQPPRFSSFSNAQKSN